METELQPADLCLLFGGLRSAEARVQETIKLWNRNYIDQIIVSGGRKGRSEDTEAEQMAAMLREFGVPAAQIIIENRSQNTGENVAFSMEKLNRLGLLEGIRSVIAVGRFSASRRYLMTLERYWPDVIKMLAPVNYHSVDVADWVNDRLLCGEVVAEWCKLRPYLNAGFLKELNPETCKLLGD
ncbi:YdcF family protein [Roseibium sp.]|uniref:YdcF family protein n=1 Tax=Roseibium sp. TaxID=1936156 RepID=UPI00262368B0|nr:YdcF family protein [Roseibium sp.]